MADYLKGICRLSLVTMRAKPDQSSEQVSQLIYGEHYMVLSTSREWYKIKLAFDGTEGWILRHHHHTISDEYFEQIENDDYQITTDTYAQLQVKNKKTHLVLGSILPLITNGLFQSDDQITFSGNSKSLSKKLHVDTLLQYVDLFQNVPYLKGGRTIFGVDEGGFIQQIFRLCGYTIHRTLSDIKQGGKSINSLADLVAGDIVIAGEKKFQLGLIYLGNDQYTGVIEGQVRKITNPDFVLDKVAIKRVIR